MHFLKLNLIIAVLFGCFTLVSWLIKFIYSINLVWESFIKLNVQILKNY